MKFDSIVFDSMSPDSSEWAQGLKLAYNCIPHDTTYRELGQAQTKATLALGVGESAKGRFSDPAGRIYLATGGAAASKIWTYDGAATFTNVSRGGVQYVAAPTWWRFERYGPHVIAAAQNIGGAPVPLQIQTNHTGNFADLVTSADIPDPRFICSCKSYLVGARNQGFAGAGIYAGANPYQFMWSAQNSPANWTPATNNTAGFASVNDAAGEITGLLGFKDFFLVFQQLGVTLVRWVGGNTVWEPQEIAGADFGLNQAGIVDTGIIRANRSVVYISNRGPARIDNGTDASHLGNGVLRRMLCDPAFFAAPLDWGIDFSQTIIGDFEARESYVLWTCYRKSIVTETFGLVYHLPSDRWSIIQYPTAQANVTAVVRGSASARIFDTFRILGGVGATFTAVGLDSPTQAMPLTLYCKRWRPSPGEVLRLHQARPLFLLNPPGAAYPTVTLTITPYTDPRGQGAAAVPIAQTYNSMDGGWIRSSPLPIRGEEFELALQIGAINNATIRELTGLELGYEQASTR